MKALFVGVALVLSSVLISCTEPEPSYALEYVAYDPQLVGTWRYEKSVTNDKGETSTESFDLSSALAS